MKAVTKFCINIFLISSFLFLIIAIILPITLDVCLERAKGLETDYRWKKAGKYYENATKLNPFNSKYLIESGHFLLKQSTYRKEKTPWLNRAKELYEQACSVNPKHAEYRYWIGHVKAELGFTAQAMHDFKNAVHKDPYNLGNNYLVGYKMLELWPNLDNENKVYALERLRFILKTIPWHGQYIYPKVFKETSDFSLVEDITPDSLAGYKTLYSFISKNNLWKYRKKIQELINRYTQLEEPDMFRQMQKEKANFFRETTLLMNKEKLTMWVGKSLDGRREYNNGRMYWQGVVYKLVNLPENASMIKIQAKGDSAYGIWPYMVAEINGEEIGENFVSSCDWKEYTFNVDEKPGLKILSVTFLNDGGEWEKGIDRNLYVGEVEIVRRKRNEI